MLYQNAHLPAGDADADAHAVALAASELRRRELLFLALTVMFPAALRDRRPARPRGGVVFQRRTLCTRDGLPPRSLPRQVPHAANIRAARRAAIDKRRASPGGAHHAPGG